MPLERTIIEPMPMKFSSPEEELAYLREQVAQKERLLREKGLAPEKEFLISREVHEYADKPSHEVLSPTHQMTESEIEAVTLDLPPERDDEIMAELMGIMQEKGIKNALSVASRMNNPHIADDFHRFLVEYVRKGYPAEGLREHSPLWKDLHMTLYEVSLPESENEGEKEKPLRELISSMEQFYAGLSSIADSHTTNGHYAIEMAVSEDREELVFYIAVPSEKAALFEKHLLSIFPRAQLREERSDFNIFVDKGDTRVSYATFSAEELLPIKSYHDFDYDPLNILVNAFSKLLPEGEGAAVQFVVKPQGDRYVRRYRKIIEKMEKGKKLREAMREVPDSIAGEALNIFREFATVAKSIKPEDELKEHDVKYIEQTAIDQIHKKIESPVLGVNVRIAVSAKGARRAEEILHELESSFNQFENTLGNRLKFERVRPSSLREAIELFAYREFSSGESLPLSLRELTTLIHLPSTGTESPQLKQAKAGSAPAPIGLPQEGTLMGVNDFRNAQTKIYMTDEDRLRHLYVIGQTGTGKTSLLKNMIIQDIERGAGICMIDPHGSDIEDILANIPESRQDDVIYFDPAYTERVMGLNMLEYDPRFPEQKTFVVNELLAIFKRLYAATPEAMGPAFEQYFRNSTMLVMEDPATGNTLLDIARVLSDQGYRNVKLSRSKNPVINQFWREIATQAQGEAALANIVPYITNKFDTFTTNEIMRPIISQERSAFNFREIMDEKKILLVNLSKGRLGEINANLIGLILVGKILMAALSRVDTLGKKELPPFYLYIDEFQNITTDSISAILSEARKYKLSLTVAHQFIAQLDQRIREAVFGNVGSMAVFRVGAEDADFLKAQFEPVFSARDIMNIDNFNCYLRLLSKGVPQKPFNIQTMRPKEGNRERAEYLKKLSYLSFGRPRDVVEHEIAARYRRA
jgi:DNA helicase HerA-like ATPase